jgi:glycosyltransferase involved in cell wall biosynthesis
MKISFLIRSLAVGGSEQQLVEVARGLKRKGHEVIVLVFYPGGPLEEHLTASDVPVISLDKKGRWDIVTFMGRLLGVLREQRADFLYAFLGVPCILTAFVKRFVPELKIVWGVRAANVDLSQYDLFCRIAYGLECRLSSSADLIIANSHAGREYAIEHRFPSKNIVVIPNGIDTERFHPMHDDGFPVRTEWGVEPHEKLIGLVARLDPMKDHPTFIKAASQVAEERFDVKFVCIGDGPVEYKKYLMRLVIDIGLENKLIWAGECRDMPAVYNALDVAALSSYGEGFPNVIGEAMACEVPCVVTDVGDSALIVGDTGIVVKPRDPDALAAGMNVILAKLEKDRVEKKLRARKRICEHFGIEAMVSQTEKALSGLQ